MRLLGLPPCRGELATDIIGRILSCNTVPRVLHPPNRLPASSPGGWSTSRRAATNTVLARRLVASCLRNHPTIPPRGLHHVHFPAGAGAVSRPARAAPTAQLSLRACSRPRAARDPLPLPR